MADGNRSQQDALGRLREAGLYDPASPSAPEREELLRYLLERFSVTEIEYWVEQSSLMGVAARAIDRPPAFVSADEIAARAGVDVDTVVDVRTAFGFPVVDPKAPSIPESAVDDVGAFVLGAELYGRDEALAFARVLGWAAARVGEAARAMFGGSVERMDAATRTELEMAKANERAAVAWMQVQSVMAHLLAEHPLRNFGFVEALMRGELQVALAFVDLIASTEWAESLDAAAHSEALRRFEMRAAAIAAERGARLVKLIGDEAMLVADDAVTLCGVAVAVCEMANGDAVLPGARGAVGFGSVTARDGDYFGPLVNVVARASKLAPPGGIVVTAEVARSLDPAGWSTEPVGPAALRGVTETVYLNRATPVRLERA
ncbi:MAG TPA: adenylate cyclase regulatory domain-containing protein [Acidimicrobiia bacterium]